MRILIACEESQAVATAFREAGHEAYSCDISECSGGHPEYHIQGDVLEVINQQWDMMIAHPPCTYLSNSGVRWLHTQEGRVDKMNEGALFFKAMLNATHIPKICVENPIPHKYAVKAWGGDKYTQIVQPYEYGHPESKATCLWLKGLPELKGTDDVKAEFKALPKSEAQRLHYLPPSKDRARLRSKTYAGIANAMAQQWGTL
jgi:hypothetical protein